MLVCKALLLEGKTRGLPKRGRPSLSIYTLHHTKKLRGPVTKRIPGPEIHLDGIQHLPEVKEKGGRCKNPGCNGVTVFSCAKCDVICALQKVETASKTFTASKTVCCAYA